MTTHQEHAIEPVVARAICALRTRSALPVAFGGPVLPHGGAFVISALAGTNTQSLLRLKVCSGMGLGGKTLQLARPTKVDDYPNARGITHSYDNAVAPEDLGGVVAIPLQVNDRLRAVFYVASRERISLGDRVLDAVAPVLRQAERDILVEDEVQRRLSMLHEAEPAPGSIMEERELRDIHEELRALTETVTDEPLRARLADLCERTSGLWSPPVPSAAANLLTRREREVLGYVAIGHTNNQIAEVLGLLPNTVKAYVKTAIRKMNVGNRAQAAYRAREAGLIDIPPQR